MTTEGLGLSDARASGRRDDYERVFFVGHPSWRAMLDFYARGLLAAVLAGVLAGIVSAAAEGHVQVGWVVAAVLAVAALAALRGYLERMRTTYTITSERLTIETGLLSHELHQTRLERVQNISSRQSLRERLLGVGTVDFDTAGMDFEFAFRGVSDPQELVRTLDRALREARRFSHM